MATGVFTTRSPERSPDRSSTAAMPGNMPAFGAASVVVNPAPRQLSMRGSLGFTSSAALRQGVVAGRSSGPRESGGRALGSLPEGAAGAITPTSENASNNPG